MSSRWGTFVWRSGKCLRKRIFRCSIPAGFFFESRGVSWFISAKLTSGCPSRTRSCTSSWCLSAESRLRTLGTIAHWKTFTRLSPRATHLSQASSRLRQPKIGLIGAGNTQTCRCFRKWRASRSARLAPLSVRPMGTSITIRSRSLSRRRSPNSQGCLTAVRPASSSVTAIHLSLYPSTPAIIDTNVTLISDSKPNAAPPPTPPRRHRHWRHLHRLCLDRQ
jgi:hypothetical protein